MSDLKINPNLPTFHHLNDSQSQRILWLLEELEVKYNIELYSRHPRILRAPPSLATVSPLGKSPVWVTPDGQVITESSAIATYLLKTYDNSNRFENTDWLRDEIISSFSGTSLGLTTTLELFLDLAHRSSPWPISWLVRVVWKSVHTFFTGKELRNQLSWLENELGEKDWFGGSKLSKADIMVSWPLDLIVMRNWINVNKEFPKLWEWRQNVRSRHAWKSGMMKGNGYDLSQW